MHYNYKDVLKLGEINMVVNTNVELLSEMLQEQMESLTLEENILHTKIFDKSGKYLKNLQCATEFDFFMELSKELEVGNSFGLIYLDDINKEDSEKHVYCSLAAIHKLEFFIELKDSHYEVIAESYDLEVNSLLQKGKNNNSVYRENA